MARTLCEESRLGLPVADGNSTRLAQLVLALLPNRKRSDESDAKLAEPKRLFLQNINGNLFHLCWSAQDRKRQCGCWKSR